MLISTVAFSCLAEADHQERNKDCSSKAGAYMTAAMWRDAGVSPQETLARMRNAIEEHLVTEAFLKNAINNLYFDPGFSHAGGQGLYDQLYSYCMNPKSFTPLK